jgi:hypothetical protein
MHRTFDFVRSTHNQDRGTVLDLRNGRLFRLNFTASLIWERLCNGQPQLQIATYLHIRWGDVTFRTKHLDMLFDTAQHGMTVNHPIYQELYRAASSFVSTEGSGVCATVKMQTSRKLEIRMAMRCWS